MSTSSSVYVKILAILCAELTGSQAIQTTILDAAPSYNATLATTEVVEQLKELLRAVTSSIQAHDTASNKVKQDVLDAIDTSAQELGVVLESW